MKQLAEIIELKGDIWQIDLLERGEPGATAAYLVKGDDGWMLVETGPATSAERILEATASLGIAHHQVRHMAVTHIHLDHAGGLGTLARHFKAAKIWVHAKGHKHMVDPHRLVEGSRFALGAQKMEEYGDVLPVPRERLFPANEGTKISLGGNRVLEIWETPGHARHHVCFYDVHTRGLFSGDAAGIYFPRLSKMLNRPVLRPATPAPDFNGTMMWQTLYRLALTELNIIYFAHFGAASPAKYLIELVIGQLAVQMHMAGLYLAEPDGLQKLRLALRKRLEMELGVTVGEEIMDKAAVRYELEFLLGPLQAAASGLLEDLKRVTRP